jgi:TonB family protein
MADLASTLASIGTIMRRFLQFLFTFAMGASLLYLFAGKHGPEKGIPKEIATQSQAAESRSLATDSLVAADTVPSPGGASDDRTDTAGIRSTAEILGVIRRQTPGLRHAYNQSLLTHPGMKGKLVFKLRIAPSGALADVVLISSTTGEATFDEAIAEKVRTWRFKPVSAKADDIVTVPFTFSE